VRRLGKWVEGPWRGQGRIGGPVVATGKGWRACGEVEEVVKGLWGGWGKMEGLLGGHVRCGGSLRKSAKGVEGL